MSGLVVAYGRPDRSELQAAFTKISHRGPYAEGIFEGQGVIMSQNYLEADRAGREGTNVPVVSPDKAELRICYDGQVGNWNELARAHGISDGPYREERLFLHLYQKGGRDMLGYLNDAVFAFVIFDGNELFAARDLLGIKTLYYGWKGKTLYLASELKSILELTEEVYEFPPGHYMDGAGRLTRYAELSKVPPKEYHSNLDRMMKDIRAIIERSLRSRLDFRVPTGSLLSGGLDSSVIAHLASKAYVEKFGGNARLKTFALGTGKGSDIQNARAMATYLNTDHRELIVELKDILQVLPEVIYYLESFDPSLVRSSVSNFLISQYARGQGMQVLLSGEGGDEVFCGYDYLKDFPTEDLFHRQIECIGFLHNNAALRLDRMNQCHGLRHIGGTAGLCIGHPTGVQAEIRRRSKDRKVDLQKGI